MSIIRFTEADRLAGKTLEKGYYTAQITQLVGPTASSSGKSITFEATFTITKGPFANKELSIFFNTESSGSSLLGTRQYVPHNWLLSKVAPAILGVPFAEVPLELDTDSLLNQQLDISVGVETSGGNVENIINGFVPAGKGSVALPF
jgi:hypothetical protein